MSDSRDVNLAIKERIWPELKKLGFDKTTDRNAWRAKKDTVEVINFQSFNKHLADSIGCTTFSFGVNCGVFYNCCRRFKPLSSGVNDEPPEFPQEFHCQARLFLTKHMKQNGLFNPGGIGFPFNVIARWFREANVNDRPDIWYAKKDGSNLDEIVRDAWVSIQEQALPWFERMSDLRNAQKVFQIKQEVSLKGGISIEMLGGGLNSLARAETISCIHLALGNPRAAVMALEQIGKDPHYRNKEDVQKAVRQRIGDIQNNR